MQEKNFYPITHSQRRIWYTEMLHSSGNIYNLGFSQKLIGKIDYLLLNQAINRVIKDNDSLRIRLKQQNNQEPVQYFVEYQDNIFDFFDFSSVNDSQIEDWMKQKLHVPFQFYDTDLYYFSIIKLSDEETIVFCKIHHIITDGLSVQILVKEIINQYENISKGTEKVAEKGAYENSYVCFIEHEEKYLNSSRFKKDEVFWLEEFETLPSTNGLKTFNPYMTSTKSLREVFNVSKEFREKIRELSEKYNFSLFTIFVAGLQLALHRWTSSEDIVLGMAYGNRVGKNEKKMTGMMVSTLPLRINIDSEEETLKFLSRLERKKRKILKHQKYPYNILNEKIKEKEVNFERFFGISVDYRYEELSEKIKNEFNWISNGHEDNELNIHIVERPTVGDLVLLVDYREKLFSSKEIRCFINSMFVLLDNLLKKPDQNIKELNILSPEEEQLLLVDFNKSKLPSAPLNRLAHQVIEDQVEKWPESIAAVCGKDSITYRELNEQANQLANWLREQGFGRDDLAVLFAERSIEMLVGILAVLKAGGAYVPLDSMHPDSRLLTVLENSSAKVILTEAKWQSRSLELSQKVPQDVVVFSLDAGDGSCTDIQSIDSYSTENLEFINEPSDLANVFFTSGSTGQPKGAMVEHIGMLNHLYAKINLLGLNENSIVAQNASHCFDISVWQFLAPLMTGGKVVIYSNEVATDPQVLLRVVQKDKISVLEMVPSIIEMFLQTAHDELNHTLPDLQFMISTGEGLPVSLCRRWVEAYPHVKVVNTYGATECSDDTSHEVISGIYPYDNHPQVGLGTPIPNIHYYLLDAWQRPVPIGCIGEVYIAGIGVGRGYLNDPERTDEAFLRNPFIDGAGERMYKTGDLARFTPDGRLVFVSRADFQVKVRGYRIELGEIESVLLRNPVVSQCVAVVQPDTNGNNRLLAYVILREKVDMLALKQYLRKHLPEYMVPEHLTILEEMPLNRNGKIDRKALPGPDEFEREGEKFTAPRDEWEIKLVKIWEEVLEISSIGIDDNIFQLGGHSLKMIQIRSRIKQHFDIELILKDLFDYQTIRELAAVLRETVDGKRETNREAISGIIPMRFNSEEVESNLEQILEKEFSELSSGMKRVWFRAQYTGNTFGDIVAYEMTGEIDSAALDKALYILIQRHGILRTTVIEQEGRPYQQIQDSLEVPFRYEDLSILTKNEQFKRLESAVTLELSKPFDLSNESFFRMAMYRLEQKKHLLLVCGHHIGFDGWSHQVFMKDLFTVYQVIINGGDSSVLSKPMQYIDFTRWQNEQLHNGCMESQRMYWMGKLGQTVDVPSLPYDININLEEHNPSDVRVRTLPMELVHSLRKMNALYKGTTFMSVLAAVKIWLALQTNQTDITIGSTLTGRTSVELEEVLGLCINPVALRTDLSSNPTFQQVLERVQVTTMDAYNNQDYPFDFIMQDLRGISGENLKLYSISFIGQYAHQKKMEFEGITVRLLTIKDLLSGQDTLNVQEHQHIHYDERVEFDLLMSLIEEGDTLQIETNYNSRKFKPELVDSFLQQIEYVLTQLVENPQLRISQVKLIKEESWEELFEN